MRLSQRRRSRRVQPRRVHRADRRILRTSLWSAALPVAGIRL
jgi:hypothetical protein